MSDGVGCKCYSRCEAECACSGVDWRSAREVELEAENAKLKAEIKRLKRYIDKYQIPIHEDEV